MGGAATCRGDAESPGSGGASPYLRRRSRANLHLFASGVTLKGRPGEKPRFGRSLTLPDELTKVRQGPKIRVEQPFVGSDREAVRHAGDVIAKNARASAAILLRPDNSIEAFRHKA
jgi:hypothetical protein